MKFSQELQLVIDVFYSLRQIFKSGAMRKQLKLRYVKW